MNQIPKIFIELLQLEDAKQKLGRLEPKKRVLRKDELISLNKKINLKLEEAKNIYLTLDLKIRSEVKDYFYVKEYKVIFTKLDKKLPIEPVINKSTIQPEKITESSRLKKDTQRIVHHIIEWINTYNAEEKDKLFSFLTNNIFHKNYIDPSIYADKDNSILVFSILRCIKELDRRTHDINQNLIYRNAISKICYYFPFAEQSNESEYHGQICDEMFHGFGVKIDNKYTDIYIGEFQKNKRSGFGLQVYDNGDFYFGDFQNDHRHGYGQYCWSDGDQESSYWLQGEQTDIAPLEIETTQIVTIDDTKVTIDNSSFIKSLPPFEAILEMFKKAHTTDFKILETNNEKLNNLIRLVVMDNHISDIEKRFLAEKTKELNLTEELTKHAASYLESDNPFLDKIFELIFSDGIITKNELAFIHEKANEIGLFEDIVNQRFWAYGIHFHLNDLLAIDDFKTWVVTWYLFSHYCYKDTPDITNTDKVFDIFTGTDFNLIIKSKSEFVLKECIEYLDMDISFAEIYNAVFPPKVKMDLIKMDLNEVSDIHKDALCWFNNNESNTITYLEVKGEKVFNSGQVFLFNSAKGIHKPAGWDFALSIKILLDSPYDDQIKETLNGNWILKYHKEDDNKWTNESLIKCMESKIPIGIFYQTKRPPSPNYKIYGLGIIQRFDGDYFHITRLNEEDRSFFDWNPLKVIDFKENEIEINGLIIQEDKEIAQAMKDLLKIEKINSKTSTNIAACFTSTKPMHSTQFKYDFIFCDINAPLVGEITLPDGEKRRINKVGAIFMLEYLKLFNIVKPVIVTAKSWTADQAIELYSNDAFDIMVTPINSSDFIEITRKAINSKLSYDEPIKTKQEELDLKLSKDNIFKKLNKKQQKGIINLIKEGKFIPASNLFLENSFKLGEKNYTKINRWFDEIESNID